ncbi:MAG: hypothetical protein GEU71_00155 [Actinobacteria bacterium]|nr:hypothetical protein [Actinomycetota bacterium]
MTRRASAVLCVGAMVTALLVALPATSGAQLSVLDAPVRDVEPVVLTGDRVPGWSRLAATGLANPYPSGTEYGDNVRDAHNGTLTVPPDPRTGVDPATIAAYRWNGKRYIEVPVQVDERFPYFLANANSDFGFYSGTDEELTYAWDSESWKKTAGDCFAAYPEGAEAMADPVPTLDDDDEIAFMASDAGAAAPADAVPPPGALSDPYDITLNDPFAPGTSSHIYLFTTESGSRFDSSNGYVDYERDANADDYIDRGSFADDDPEKLGSSNTGYGPNLSGTVCDPDGSVRESTDRFPRDGVTVSTSAYRWRATGRWMVRSKRVAKPGQPGVYGPDLLDRWKGRAFQQSPDSTISLVGFEDEQVNWEANSSLLGELAGPVRAIREVWGADSGTNVTKIETFYRDTITYRFHVRVHPIPPDGLYTSWDYNHDKVGTYYNEALEQGVPIDGVNDEAVGNIDDIFGEPAFFDAPDPTFTRPLAFLNWEQVAGRGDGGSLIYMFELKNANALENPLVTPYYRDDACLDDGTGDDPSRREWPGESYAWMTERELDYVDRPCFGQAPEGYEGLYKQGAFGSHGIHYFVTNDTDNLMLPKPITEIDGQQTEWLVPMAAPARVGDRYANTAKAPLIATPSMLDVPELPGFSNEPEPEPTPTPTPTPSPSPTTDDTPQPADPGDGAAVTIDASDTLVPYRGKVVLSGTVTREAGCTAPVVVELYRRTMDDRLSKIDTVVPDGSDNWKASAKGTESTVYSAAVESKGNCSDGESDGALVEVEAKISLGRYNAETRILKGSVRPRHTRTEVLLQRKVKGGWTTVATDRLNRRSDFALKESLRPGRYRILWEQQSPTNARSVLRFRFTR